VTARRYCRKRFVLGSATAMPFGDSEFDAVWSIWVLEHVPNPEQALCEIRRVVRPGGVVYLRPAWLCTPFAAQGCSVRPYSDFNWRGKITKATMPWRRAVQRFTLPVVRVARHVSWALSGGPSRLRDVRLTPNYEHYWEPDSDAVNSLDPFEVALWFRSRGDRCLSCPEGRAAYFEFPDALILQIQKQK
jgi:SAM-dependent methyltransferase